MTSWIFLALSLVFIGGLVRQAFRGSMDNTILDLTDSMNPEKVLRGKNMIRVGKLLLAIVVPISFALAFWRVARNPDWKWFLPFFVALATTVALIAVGTSWIRRYSKGSTDTPDPRATTLLRSIAEYDRPLWTLRSRRRLNWLIGELVDYYTESGETVRAAIRRFFSDSYLFSSKLLRITAEASRSVGKSSDLTNMEDIVRRGVIAVSIFYECGDYREALMALDPLYRQSKKAGVDIENILREVAHDSYSTFERFVEEFIGNAGT